MARSVARGAGFLMTVLLAWLLLQLGELSATGSAPNLPTINAFLFLMGLSGAARLLSPPSARMLRLRYRL